ncbi:hypothetical protein VP424E501_P0247 [Vibrio phage 424E50-1]|nr:hypothetical protein VP424E501_P0247 [Vibrio phage 424E50-1]
MMYAIVFECTKGELLLLEMSNGQFALYSEKEDAIEALSKTLKDVNYELEGSPVRYGNGFWGYRTVRQSVSDKRKETLLRLKATIQVKQPSALDFKDGTSLKGSK